MVVSSVQRGSINTWSERSSAYPRANSVAVFLRSLQWDIPQSLDCLSLGWTCRPSPSTDATTLGRWPTGKEHSGKEMEHSLQAKAGFLPEAWLAPSLLCLSLARIFFFFCKLIFYGFICLYVQTLTGLEYKFCIQLEILVLQNFKYLATFLCTQWYFLRFHVTEQRIALQFVYSALLV